jgi:2,3-bisphosphoglycerate-dependent phosphoglycerate mutase
MDPELTAIGVEQAGLLAEFISRPRPVRDGQNERDPQNISGFRFTHLYSSLMERAVATAGRMAEALDLPVHIWVDLHEEGGIYLDDEATGERAGKPGHGRSYFEQKYPRLVLSEELSDAGWWNRPFEVEEQRRPRARRFLVELLKRHGDSDDRVAVVSHGGFYNHFISEILGLPTYHPYGFMINNVAITRIDIEKQETGITYMNRLDFLPRELIT